MPNETMLDKVATDLALWLDQESSKIALAMAPQGVSPFAAPISETQKLEYYRDQLFNPDGTPNLQGRNAQIQRLGPQGFTQVYKAVLKAYPQLRVPSPPPGALGPPTAPPGPITAVPSPAPPPPPGIPAMAQGGIVTQPTVALIGEQGPEAVVPLSNYQMPDPDLAAHLGGAPSVPGLISAGNVNLGNRPIVRNADGTISTVRSISFEDDDGHEVLVPTVSDDGRVMSNQEAIDQYYDTGRHLGIFSSPDAATAYAMQLHAQQATQYGGR